MSHDAAFAGFAPAGHNHPPQVGPAVEGSDRLLGEVSGGTPDPETGEALVDTLPGPPDEDWPQQVYDALRGWTWRAINDRHRDAPMLRAWCRVLDRASALLEESQAEAAARLRGCHELIAHSLLVAENALRPEQALKRMHVPELLVLLADAGRPLSRTEIAESLGLNKGNVSRITELLLEAGLIERSVRGREARFAPCGEAGRFAVEAAHRMSARHDTRQHAGPARQLPYGLRLTMERQLKIERPKHGAMAEAAPLRRAG